MPLAKFLCAQSPIGVSQWRKNRPLLVESHSTLQSVGVEGRDECHRLHPEGVDRKISRRDLPPLHIGACRHWCGGGRTRFLQEDGENQGEPDDCQPKQMCIVQMHRMI